MKGTSAVLYVLQISSFLDLAIRFAFPSAFLSLGGENTLSIQQLGFLLFVRDIACAIAFLIEVIASGYFPRFLLLAMAQIISGTGFIVFSFINNYNIIVIVHVISGIGQTSWLATGLIEVEKNLSEDTSQKKLIVVMNSFGILASSALLFAPVGGHKRWFLAIGIIGIISSLFSLIAYGKTKEIPKEPLNLKKSISKLFQNKLFILILITQAIEGTAINGLYFLLIWLNLAGISKMLSFVILSATLLSFVLASWCGMHLKLQKNRIGQLIVSHGGFIICGGLNFVLYQAITSKKGSEWAYYLAVCALNGFVTGWAAFSFEIPSCVETIKGELKRPAIAILFIVRNFVSSGGSIAIGILANIFESDTRTLHESMSFALLLVVSGSWGFVALLYMIAYPLTKRTKPIIETAVTTIEAKDLEASVEPVIIPPPSRIATPQKPKPTIQVSDSGSRSSVQLPNLNQLEEEHSQKKNNIIQNLIQLRILDKSSSDRVVSRRFSHSTSTVLSVKKIPSFDVGDESPDMPK